jgi:hypothetical protein
MLSMSKFLTCTVISRNLSEPLYFDIPAENHTKW